MKQLSKKKAIEFHDSKLWEDMDDLEKIRETTKEILQILNPILMDCPFCGNDEIRIEKHIHGRLFAHCLNSSCGANSGFCDSIHETKMLWNKRP